MKQETINKRLDTLLKVKCAGCARCCKETIVPITHRDLKRIMKRTGQTADHVVRFATPSEINFEKDSEYWIRTNKGKRAMVLRKKSGQCQYLDNAGRCTIYTDRPITCRTFPIILHLDEEQNIIDLSLNRIVKDRYPSGTKRPLKSILEDSKVEHREDFQYHDLVKTWNEKNSQRSSEAFLKFVQKF